MSTGPKQGRGGKREGAGRKPDTLSAATLRERLQKAKERAEKEKKTVDEVLLDFIYDIDMPKKDRISSMKLWYDITTPKIVEGGEADQANGPGIYLPEEKPDPAVVIQLKQAG